MIVKPHQLSTLSPQQTHLKLEATWLGLGHAGHAERLVVVDPLGISVCSTTRHVDDDKNDEHDNVDNRDLAPAVLDAGEHTRFA